MRAVSYALVAVTLLWSAAAAQNNPDQRLSASSGSAQGTGPTASSARGRRLVIGNRGRKMCRPRSRRTSEQGRSKTRPSTGNCASAAIADVCLRSS
jgi:hypothetical protein